MRLLGPVLTAHYLAAFTALGLPVFMPRLLQDLAPGAPSWLAGLLYVLPTVCTALTSAAWGRFADRHGRKLSLMRAQLGLAIGFAMAGFATELWVFVLALVVQGSCGGSMAASNAYLSTQSQGASLSRALDWTQFSARLALVTAPALLGIATDQGLTLELYRYLAALPLAALLITSWLPADIVATPRAHVAAPTALTAERPREWSGVLAVQFLFCFAMVVTFPYFILYSEALGVGSDSLAGVLYSLPHLVYLVALPWLRSNSPAPQRRLAAGLMLLSAACIAQGMLGDPRWLAPMRVLYGMGMLLAFTGINRAMSACVAGRPVGRLFGAFDASGKWAGAAAGIGAGFIVHRFGPAMPFFVAAAAGFVALAVVLHVFRLNQQGNDHAVASDA